MAEDSKIEWTTHTFNPWRGCTKVSPGCKNCYAETLSGRNPGTLGVWGPNGTRVVAAEAAWAEPLKWDRKARAAGERHRVFCASLADVFEHWTGPMENSHGVQVWKRDDGSWTTSDHYRDTVMLTMTLVRARLLKLIHLTPNLDWLLLTKRPEFVREAVHKVADYATNTTAGPDVRDAAELAEQWLLGSPMPNVWLGASVENRLHGLPRLDKLRAVPASVRFLSVEPLLEDLGEIDLADIHWVIVGGESGHGARRFDLAWARSVVRQCRAANVPCFVKQFGARPDGTWGGNPLPMLAQAGHWSLKDGKGGNMAEWPADLRVREFPKVSA